MDAGKHTAVKSSAHNHLPDALRTLSHKYRVDLKRKSKEGTERPEKIVRICAAQYPVEVQTTMSKAAQRRVCQRQRASSHLKTDPDDYEKIDPSFTVTFDNQQLLLKNVECDEGRILIFGTITNLRRLSQSKLYMLDGTFSTAPNNFRQVFTILGSINGTASGKFLPFVHMLLPSKNERTYFKALKLLRRIARENEIVLDPEIVLTDFELAEVNAVKKIFPDSSQYGCFFHLVKNLWKRIQKLQLSGPFSKNVNIQMAFRKTEALAYLDPKDVSEGFTKVRQGAPAMMKPFFDYVEKVYIAGKLKNNDETGGTRQCKPRHPPEFWASQDNVTRTSNAIEGWHSKFNGLLHDAGNNKFYAVLRAFQQEERSTSAYFLQNLQGNAEVRKNNKYVIKEAKLKDAISLWKEQKISLEDHLQALALILQNF